MLERSGKHPQPKQEASHETRTGNSGLSGVPQDEFGKKNTIESYAETLAKLFYHFGKDRNLAAITSEEILSFLSKITEGAKQQTKHGRYSHLKAFFNFIRTNLDPTIQNPCDAPMLRRLYRPGKPIDWDVVEKETIDEIIFRTTKVRNRLILELMARGGMRVGEVLKLTPGDVNDQRLTIQSPKSGKDAEVVFVPRKVVDRLRAYLKGKAVEPEHRIFRSPMLQPGSSSKKPGN